jgi:hypothetical protein
VTAAAKEMSLARIETSLLRCDNGIFDEFSSINDLHGVLNVDGISGNSVNDPEVFW